MFNPFNLGFDPVSLFNNYDEREVAVYTAEDTHGGVSTVAMPDTDHPYETAIWHPKYNDGKLVIVAEYDTKEEAQAGHASWVEKFKADKLPNPLIDVSSAKVKQVEDLALALMGEGPDRAMERG